MYAVYDIQPDDRNHLKIYDDNNMLIAYIRPDARELKSLLSGDASFVERGAWSEEAKKKYYKVAQLFRERKIEYIVFQNYPGVQEFKYKVKPENIEIIARGFFERTYILHLPDKDVEIRTLVRSYGPGYPFKVTVTEIPRKPSTPPRAEKTSIDSIIDRLEEIKRRLDKIDSKTKKQELLEHIAYMRIMLALTINDLRKLKKQLS